MFLRKYASLFKSTPPFVLKSRVFRLFGFARAAKRADTKSPFRFSGIAARSAFTGQHAGNSGFAAQSDFRYVIGSAAQYREKNKRRPAGTPFTIKNTPGSGCVRSLDFTAEHRLIWRAL